MRLLCCAGVGALLCCSASCVGLDNKAAPSDHNSGRVKRLETLIEHLNKTMTEVAADMTPVAAALRSEVLHETKPDMSSVAEEVQTQMTHPSLRRKSRQSNPKFCLLEGFAFVVERRTIQHATEAQHAIQNRIPPCR